MAKRQIVRGKKRGTRIPRPDSVVLTVLEKAYPDKTFERARAIAKANRRALFAQAKSLKSRFRKIKALEDLLDLPIGPEEEEERLAWSLAFIIACADEAEERKCDCSKELAALQAAAQRLQQAQNALQQAQAQLAADQAQLAAAQAAERAAWNAYQAASRLTRRVCGGIGRFDPLCLVAITYEAVLGNKWNARFRALQGWQQAVDADQQLVQLCQQRLQRALQAYAQALLRYIQCILRCIFGF
jgi:hypothetical protein